MFKESEQGELSKRLFEIIERAGTRNTHEAIELWNKAKDQLNKESRRGEGRIHHAETIDDIVVGEKDSRHFQEGAIGYHKINDGEVICTSDSHGDFASLSGALEEFIRRKENGEQVYFNFSGDFSASDSGKDRIKIAEALYALKLTYPNEVFIESGNADRGHIPLFVGLGSEIAQKYLDKESYQLFEDQANRLTDEYFREQFAASPAELKEKFEQTQDENEKKKIKKILGITRFTKEVFMGAAFLGEARACGLDKFDPKDFSAKFLFGELKDFLGCKKPSAILDRYIARNLISATQDYKIARSTAIDPDKIKKAFSVYRRLSEVTENIPSINLINTPQGNIVLSHSWPVKMERLAELVYDPVEQRQAAWTKFMAEQQGIFEEKVYHSRYGPDVLAQWFKKNNVLLGQFGHNHGNRIDQLSQGTYRLEVSTSQRAKKEAGILQQPGYAVIKIDKLKELSNNHPEKVIEFKPIKKE